jgi:thioredoxin 1
MLAKTLEDVDLGMPIEVIDIDENSELAQKFGVRGVPTLIMVEDDKEIKRQVGLAQLKQLQDWAK